MSVEMSFNCKECDANITFTDGIREMERIGFLKLICKNKHINRYFRGDSIAMKDRQNSKDRLLEKLQKENTELKKKVTHWKANHDSILKLLNGYRQRPDLEIVRVKKRKYRVKSSHAIIY